MRTIVHLTLNTLVAAAMGGFGLWHLTDGHADFSLMLLVMIASCAIWIPLGIYYSHTQAAWLLWIYFGALSPLLGCLLLMPPWSFLLVFSKPIFSVGLGLFTSLFICAVSRRFAFGD